MIYVAYFFGGVFLCNALPHLIAGVSGRQLQTPFASPPFKGLSAPAVNVAWALVNLAAAYLLLVRVGTFDLRCWSNVGLGFAGFAAMGFMLARAFAKVRSETETPG